MKVFISGSNRGIGLEIVNILLQRNDIDKIYAGIRSLNNIQKNKIKFTDDDKQKQIQYIKFDINKQYNDDKFFNYFQQHGIDVIINNAAINSFKDESRNQIQSILQTNFLNTLQFTENCFKNNIINKNSIILNVGSLYGTLRGIKDQSIREKLFNANSKQDLVNLAIEYIENYPKRFYLKSWPCQAYSFSKVLLYFYTKILSQSEKVIQNNIQVYCVHPKWVKTDMGGEKAPQTAYIGAQSLLAPLDFQRQINKDLQGRMLYNGVIDLQEQLVL